MHQPNKDTLEIDLKNNVFDEKLDQKTNWLKSFLYIIGRICLKVSMS